MFKIVLRLSFLAFVIVSCSDSEDEFQNNNITDSAFINDENLTKLGLKITANKSEGNIFEKFQFKLNQNNQSSYFGDLENHLDSLVFKMSDSKITKKLFQKLPNGYTGTSSFTHNFYFPGEYSANIIGYKKDKIVYKDQIHIIVNDHNDFLAVNWNNFQTSDVSIGYSNLLSENTLAFYSSFDGNHPYVAVTNIWENISDYTSEEISIKDRNYFYNYLLKLYSTPQYSEANTPNMKSIYLQHFKKTINNDIPVNIWITAKNEIALMKEYSKTDPTQFYGYRIIAEPRN